MKKNVFIGVIIVLSFIQCAEKAHQNKPSTQTSIKMDIDTNNTMINQNKLPQTEQEWKEILTEEEYYVLRKKGTERPYTGQFTDSKNEGIYVCKGCGTELFKSEAKFDSHCGWPSFYEGIEKNKIKETPDYSHGMVRTEVTCAKCGGHLGHVFNDGPADKTGLRYCINSISLGFISKQAYDSLK
jgi:peptide-methionine (R)-S-oxide reductase